MFTLELSASVQLPRTQVNNWGRQCLPVTPGGEERVLRAHLPAIQPVMSSRPLRDPVWKNKMEITQGMTIKAVLWFLRARANSHTHDFAHTLHTLKSLKVFNIQSYKCGRVGRSHPSRCKMRCPCCSSPVAMFCGKEG